MTVDGLDLLVFLAAAAVVVLLLWLWEWCDWNEQRKTERLVERNLRRAGLL